MAGLNPFGLQSANQLAYPAGRSFGFNPTHFASQGIALGGSYVASGASVLRLDAPGSIAITGSITGLQGPIGPTINVASSSNKITSSGLLVGSSTSFTNAFIGWIGSTNNRFTPALTPPSYQAVYISSSTPPCPLQMYVDGAGAVIQTTSVIPANTPVFVVGTANNTTGYILVVTNLLTGQIYSFTAAFARTISAFTGVVSLLNDNASDYWGTGGVACTMLSQANPTLQQLLQWATDPWSFWYTRSPSIAVATQATGVTVVPTRTLMGVGV